MKRIFFSIFIVLILATGAGAGPWISGGSGGIWDGYALGTMTDGKVCTYTATGKIIACNSDAVTTTMATDTLWDAAGDLAYGTGSNTGGRLALGTAYQLLMVNSGATAPAWTSTLGATGTRLTKIWATDLELTNAPTIGGAAWTTILQPLDATLTSLAALTITEGDLIIGSGADAVTQLDAGTQNYILTMGAARPAWSNTLQIGTLNIPSADADPTAATAGQLAHDTTDTAASGGGNMKFADGTNVRTMVSVGTTFTHITRSEFLPIRYGEEDDTVTAPAAAAEINTTSTMIGRAFDKDADEGLVFWWNVPLDYVSGIKYRVYYSPAVTVAGADRTAAFSLSGCSVGNSDAIACSEGTAVVVTDELTETTDAAGDLIVSDWSTAVTVTNITAGEMAKLLFIRDISEDDYTDGDLSVTGIEIKYVGKLNPFSDY